jgi:nucleoid-associated protein YgaU
MSKKVEYKPEAYDGDSDGFVQDGTEFMRPVAEEAVEALVEAPEAAVESYTVTYGETYPSIAEKFPKAGLNNYQRSKELRSLNRNALLTGGKVIKL